MRLFTTISDSENIARDKFGKIGGHRPRDTARHPVDRSTKVTVLLTEKNQLFAYVQAQGLTLGGVRKAPTQNGA